MAVSPSLPELVAACCRPSVSRGFLRGGRGQGGARVCLAFAPFGAVPGTTHQVHTRVRVMPVLGRSCCWGSSCGSSGRRTLMNSSKVTQPVLEPDPDGLQNSCLYRTVTVSILVLFQNIVTVLMHNKDLFPTQIIRKLFISTCTVLSFLIPSNHFHYIFLI